MTNRDTISIPEGAPEPHAGSVREFVRRVDEEDLQGIEELILFGSTARGEVAGLDSDIDFLVVVSDSVDRNEIGDVIRDVAYDLMLEFGPVIEVHVVTESEFERGRESGHPFVSRVLQEGHSYG